MTNEEIQFCILCRFIPLSSTSLIYREYLINVLNGKRKRWTKNKMKKNATWCFGKYNLQKDKHLPKYLERRKELWGKSEKKPTSDPEDRQLTAKFNMKFLQLQSLASVCLMKLKKNIFGLLYQEKNYSLNIDTCTIRKNENLC